MFKIENLQNYCTDGFPCVILSNLTDRPLQQEEKDKTSQAISNVFGFCEHYTVKLVECEEKLCVLSVTENESIDKLTQTECNFKYGNCKSVAKRKKQAEQKKIVKKLHKVRENLKFDDGCTLLGLYFPPSCIYSEY